MRVKSVIFLIIFFINTGYYGIYQIMIFRSKWNSYKIISNGDHPERMKILTLSNKEAHPFDQDEVMYKGILYDVTQRITLRDSVILHLYPDSEEQNILTQLVDYFKSDNPDLAPISEKILKIINLHGIQDLISHSVTRYPKPDKWLVPGFTFLPYTPKVLNRFLRVPTPPPEHLLFV
jgi:hypothetical protein